MKIVLLSLTLVSLTPISARADIHGFAAALLRSIGAGATWDTVTAPDTRRQ